VSAFFDPFLKKPRVRYYLAVTVCHDMFRARSPWQVAEIAHRLYAIDSTFAVGTIQLTYK